MKGFFKLLSVAAIASFGAAAHAESHIDPAIAGAIKARQAHMQILAFNMGQLGAMAQEKMPYDAATAQVAADNIVAMTAVKQNAYWPVGSDSESVEGSRALPALWSDMDGVMAKAAAFGEAAAAMQAAAGTDLASLQGAMGALGGGCGGCHEAYRMPNN